MPTIARSDRNISESEMCYIYIVFIYVKCVNSRHLYSFIVSNKYNLNSHVHVKLHIHIYEVVYVYVQLRKIWQKNIERIVKKDLRFSTASLGSVVACSWWLRGQNVADFQIGRSCWWTTLARLHISTLSTNSIIKFIIPLYFRIVTHLNCWTRRSSKKKKKTIW